MRQQELIQAIANVDEEAAVCLDTNWERVANDLIWKHNRAADALIGTFLWEKSEKLGGPSHERWATIWKALQKQGASNANG